MGIGKAFSVWMPVPKVTGQAKYTQDLMTQPMMVAKGGAQYHCQRPCDRL